MADKEKPIPPWMPVAKWTNPDGSLTVEALRLLAQMTDIMNKLKKAAGL